MKYLFLILSIHAILISQSSAEQTEILTVKFLILESSLQRIPPETSELKTNIRTELEIKEFFDQAGANLVDVKLEPKGRYILIAAKGTLRDLHRVQKIFGGFERPSPRIESKDWEGQPVPEAGFDWSIDKNDES